MSFNGKHLSLEDRKIIEENINKGLRKFETAKELNKSQSTIGKEIKNNRKRRYSQVEDVPRKCKYYNECKVCIGMCSNFEEVPCLRRDKFVGACNYTMRKNNLYIHWNGLIQGLGCNQYWFKKIKAT